MAVNPLIVDDKPARVPQVVLVHEVLVCHWTAFASKHVDGILRVGMHPTFRGESMSILPLLYLFPKPPLNQEGEEIWEGIELTVETDILVAKLNAILNVGISAICKF